MATLTIRNLPDDVHDALRRQAAEHRRSMEAEARAMMEAAFVPRPTEEERQRALDELQEMGRQWRAAQNAPPGWSFTDSYLADKHLEAAWEDDRVTWNERKAWMEKLERCETTPEELEAFLATRRPDDV